MAARKREPVLPGDEYAAKLVKMYKKAEVEIEEKLAKALIRSEGEHTFTVKTLQAQKREVQRILKELLKATPEQASKLSEAAFSGGTAVARTEMERAGIDVFTGGKAINKKAVDIYANQIYERLADVVTKAGMTTMNIYDALALDSALSGAVAGYEPLSSVRRSMEKVMKGKGVVGFVDRSGRQWNISSYVDMLTRTATTEIYNTAKTREFISCGEDLIIITSHGTKCKLCRPWEGKVLSLTGETKGYTSLEEAKNGGLFHPNCRHDFSLYIPDDPEEGILSEAQKKKQLEVEREKLERRNLAALAEKIGEMPFEEQCELVNKIAEYNGVKYTKSNKTKETLYVDDSGYPVYPPDEGFRTGSKKVTLKEGVIVKRYGGIKGQFFTDKDEPFDNLALPYDESEYKLHKYMVTKDIPHVRRGSAIPWFDKHGGGTQFRTKKSVSDLLRYGFIKEIN